MQTITAKALTDLTYLFSQGQLEADENGIFGAQVGDEWVTEDVLEALVSTNVHVLDTARDGDTALVQVLAWIGPEWVQGAVTVFLDSDRNKFIVAEENFSTSLKRALDLDRAMGLDDEEAQSFIEEMTAVINAAL